MKNVDRPHHWIWWMNEWGWVKACLMDYFVQYKMKNLKMMQKLKHFLPFTTPILSFYPFKRRWLKGVFWPSSLFIRWVSSLFNPSGPYSEGVPRNSREVVSIGAFVAFTVIFSPLKYIPSIPPLSSYVINIYFVKRENHRYLMTRDV